MRVHVAVSALFASSLFAWAVPVQAATISALRVDPAPGGATRVIIGFSGPPPAYRVYGTGSPELTLQFPQTQAAQNVPANLQGAGSVVFVRYALSGAFALVTIRLTDPVPVRITADARNVYVDVVAQPPPQALASAAPPRAAAPSLPQVVEVIPLKYADVSEVVGILVQGQSIPTNDVFAPQPSQLGQPGSIGVQVPQQQTLNTSTFFSGAMQQQSMGQRVTDQIAIDRRLNAVILSGSPAQVEAMRTLISRIDIPLPSVLLETQIVELTDTAAKAIGIDFSSGGPIATVQAQLRSFNTPNGAVSLQAAIFDIVSRGGGKLIARPSVVAQHGIPASILTGDAIPIITSVTSFGSSTVTQQQVQYVSVGVNLQIQARIASDGYVTSHVFSEVSSVTGFVQTFPQISQRVATTTATVRDGEAFVIGGLIRETELHNLDKIPGLGSLPVVGGLFRNRRESRISTNLYIVITPHIIQRAAPAGSATPPAH